MPRRRRLSSARLLLAAAAVAVIAAPPLLAQSVAPATQPPNALSAPPADSAAEQDAATRGADTPRRPPIGQLPRFGVPAGAGAGTTGFVSSNPNRFTRSRARASPQAARTARGRTAGLARPAGLAPPPAAVSETGFIRPRRRAGLAAAPIQPQPGSRRRARPAEEDPFAPTGITVGAFTLRPAIELRGGYDSNPGRSRNGRGSPLWIVAPEAELRSNWLRHELRAELRGSMTRFTELPSVDSRAITARIVGRVDVTNQTRLDLEGRALWASVSPNRSDLPADLAELPLRSTVGGTFGIGHRFNRFEVALRGTYDRIEWDESRLTDGTSASNADRNYTQYGALLRGSYELTPGVRPFVEAGVDTRRHDLAVDANGIARDSNGWLVRAGTTFEFSRKLTGEVAAGYLTRVYADATLPDLRGAIVEASLVWTATPLTTLRLTARTTADETITPGVSGTLVRDAGLEIEHAFRRWLTGTVRLGYGSDVYVGSGREDERYLLSAALTYKLSRVAQLKAEARREWRTSNLPGNDYTANVFIAGLRFQR